MKRTFTKLIAALALNLSVPTAYSSSDWYLSYGAGIARAEIASDALVNNNSGASPPYNNDIYTTNTSNNPAFLIEIGKRWEIPATRLKNLSLGLQYQHFLATDIGREVTQYSSPDFLNYRYSLDLEANIVLLNAKVELFFWKKIVPFINLGAGLLQLIATDYGETAFPGVTPRTSPGFRTNENYRLTYQIGAGINWELNQTSFVSLNYIYQPLTDFETKGGKSAWSNRKLDFGDTYAHSIFITFTQILTR